MKLIPALATFGAILTTASHGIDVDVVVQDPILVPSPALVVVEKPLPLPKMDFVVINTQNTDYLQTEFSGLLVGIGVRIDSISLQSVDSSRGDLRANLEVHWRWAARGRDTIHPASRRMQFIHALDVPFAYSQPGTQRAALQVDTIWTCNDGRCQIAQVPKVVRNHDSRHLFCAVACMFQDSTRFVEVVRSRIHSTGMALALRPSRTATSVSGMDWTRATGEEEIWGLSVKLPGNSGNWISRDLARFDIAPLAYPAASKPSIPRSLDYPEGPAQYTYNRTNSPNLMIAEEQDVRVVNDTLVKFGKSLFLIGNTRLLCSQAIDDSDAVEDSWLVVPDSADAGSIERALSPAMCGLRSSAWRMTGDTVWLGKTKWPIRVQDLLGTSSLGRRDHSLESGFAPKLSGSRLELPWDATVVARDLSGRRLGASFVLTAGSHELVLAGHRGAFLLEIRSVDGGQASLLRGSAFAR
ncbi:MAG: hypothetical protein IPK50_10785 [Fibrobacterota bacterium]|nr:hypothetical protein [Fibrobacterota bacterium]QQS07362.1 MAG: hypothetical protein IPK50_10785 [Fibrobacterota bacterium]